MESRRGYQEKDAWILIDSFFQHHGVVGQQISSFNDFINKTLPKIINDMPQIEIHDRQGTRHMFKLLGSSCKLDKPTFTEVDASITKLFPNTARLRNLTYSAALYCRVQCKTIGKGKLEKINVEETKKYRFLGYIPVMVMSDYCRVKTDLKCKKDYEKKGECSSDPGGYFIIKGKERIIMPQERAANNTVFVFSKYCNNKSILECEIRSALDDSPSSANAIWVSLQELSVEKVKTKTQNECLSFKQPVLKVKFPGLHEHLDISLLYQALDFANVGEVMDSIVKRTAVQDESFLGDSDCLTGSQLKIQEILQFSFRNWKSRSSDEAKDAICELFMVSQMQDCEIDQVRRRVDKLLHKEFLPHVGTTPGAIKQKGYFLSYMVWKLLMIHTTYMPFDDRDHLQNKRYHFSGPLLAQLVFRSAYILISETRKTLEMQSKKGSFDIDLAIKPSIITHALTSGLSTGNWGDIKKVSGGTGRIYSGVTQELNRFTRVAHLSCLRRANSPEDKLALMTKPRQLHNTYFGVICPFETPEGKPIGLVKNLAFQAQVTVSYPVQPILDFLFAQASVIKLESAMNPKEPIRKGLTKIFANGLWLGFTNNPTELVSNFRCARKSPKGGISPFVSICWDRAYKNIDIRSDAGRLCRPLLVVESNRNLLSPALLEKVKCKELSWPDLIETGVVEMIDVRESESCMIAMFQEDLDKNLRNRIQYTHMEIHPAMMLGVCASTVPFTNHNQSPRVVYQAGIAKQAMGLYVTNLFKRMDPTSHYLLYPQRPLVTTKPMKYFQFTELPAGANCVVAISTFHGYNMEDSIIINRSAIDRGLFRSMMFQTLQDTAKKNYEKEEVFCFPDFGVTRGLRHNQGSGEYMELYNKLDSDGLVSPGTRVHENDVVIGKVVELSDEEKAEMSRAISRKDARGLNVVKHQYQHSDLSTTVKKPFRSIIDQVMVTNNSETERHVKVRMRAQLIPQVGDKFASLHGQKGVVGMDFRQEDMLFTKDGITPDLIMNPHGIPSRMTIGQLLECVFAKAGALEGVYYDGTPFHTSRLWDVSRALREHGFERYGMELMYDGATGRKQTCQTFIGPTFYQRLKHLVDDKIHSRSRGQIVQLTRQPVQGFSQDGGLRLGEMERDCVISHGGGLFLIERLMTSSDAYNMPVCGGCGIMVSPQPVISGSKYYECLNCPRFRNTSRVYTVCIPYAAKLLFQELMTMNIVPRIFTSLNPEDETSVNDGETFTAEHPNPTVQELITHAISKNESSK